MVTIYRYITTQRQREAQDTPTSYNQYIWKWLKSNIGVLLAKKRNVSSWENKWLGDNQTGGKKETSLIETAIIDELIKENHRITRETLCIHQDDAMGCYDRIICNHTTLNSRKYNIPENLCKVHSIAHDKMKFRNRIGNKVSNITYTSTEELKLHGAGQWTGNEGTHWTFISVPMMETVEQAVPGYTIQLPNNHKTWEVKMLGFVDDKKHYVNNILKN